MHHYAPLWNWLWLCWYRVQQVALPWLLRTNLMTKLWQVKILIDKEEVCRCVCVYACSYMHPYYVAVSIIKISFPLSPLGVWCAVFDISGTGPEVKGNCNAPRAVTLSVLIYCLRCMVGHDVPLNQVTWKHYHVSIVLALAWTHLQVIAMYTNIYFKQFIMSSVIIKYM